MFQLCCSVFPSASAVCLSDLVSFCVLICVSVTVCGVSVSFCAILCLFVCSNVFLWCVCVFLAGFLLYLCVCLYVSVFSYVCFCGVSDCI